MATTTDKPKPRYPTSEEYPQLMSGAHRKPATPLGAPALVGRIAFWQEEPNGVHKMPLPRKPNGQLCKPRSWASRTDDYLRTLFIAIKDREFDCRNTDTGSYETNSRIFLFENTFLAAGPSWTLESSGTTLAQPGYDRHFNTRNPAIVFSFTWRGFRAVLRAERHQEYLTLDVLLDFSESKLGATSTEEEGKLHQEIKDKLLEFAKRVDAFNPDHASFGTKEATETEREACYPFHDYFYHRLWDDFRAEILPSGERVVQSPDAWGDTAKDLGQCIGHVFGEFRGLILGQVKDEDKAAEACAHFRPPDWRTRDIHRKFEPPVPIDVSVAYALVRRLWPFVTSARQPLLRRHEFTVTGMLAGSALYLTALGAQKSPYVDGAQEDSPVYFLLYMQSFSRWQIGRLIDTILHQGTVRLAAIVNLHLLARISDELRRSPVPATTRGIRAAQEKLSRWDGLVSGGAAFRIERSRHYVKEFKEGLRRLRIRRLEGYQPYDEFVLKRLSSTFDFIDRLGNRLDRWRARLDANADANTAEAMKGHTLKLVQLQRVAEGALWFVFVPYYAGGIVEHFAEPWPAGWDHPFGETLPLGCVQGVVLAIAWILGAWRLWKLREEVRAEDKKDS